MARSKSENGSKVTAKAKGKRKGGKKKVKGAVPQVVRILSLNGAAPMDGQPVALNPPNAVLTVVGFVKPAGSTVDCQIYTSNGTLLAAPRQVNAAPNGFRWIVQFTQADGLAPGNAYMFEGNLDNTTVSAFVTFST
jgi:hypothetical protein